MGVTYFREYFYFRAVPKITEGLIIIFYFWIFNLVQTLLIILELNKNLVNCDFMFKKMITCILMNIINNLSLSINYLWGLQIIFGCYFLQLLFFPLINIIYGIDFFNFLACTLTSFDFCLQVIDITWYEFAISFFGEKVLNLSEIKKYILLGKILRYIFYMFIIFLHFCIIYFFIFWKGLKIK